MSAGIYNITIDQGSDFALDLTLNEEDSAFDLTGYSARAQLRRRKNDTDPAATFTCTIPNAAAGSIKIELSNSVTASLTAGIYYYDLELFQNQDSVVQRVLQGKAQVIREITR